MTPQDPSAAAPPIDPASLLALRAMNPGDDSFLREIIQIFLDDSPARISEIEQGLASADTRLLTRAAHSLKGSSSNFGAARLQAVCEKIEKLGRTGSLAEVPPLLAQVKTEFAAVRSALEAVQNADPGK